METNGNRMDLYFPDGAKEKLMRLAEERKESPSKTVRGLVDEEIERKGN